MMNLPERREMRISDAERDDVAAILREAAGEGRLDLEELDERLTAVYAAKTYGDLEPITRDLPTPSSSSPATPRGERFGGVPGSSVGIGVMSGFERTGPWVVPEEFTAVAFWGGVSVKRKATDAELKRRKEQRKLERRRRQPE